MFLGRGVYFQFGPILSFNECISVGVVREFEDMTLGVQMLRTEQNVFYK